MGLFFMCRERLCDEASYIEEHLICEASIYIRSVVYIERLLIYKGAFYISKEGLWVKA